MKLREALAREDESVIAFNRDSTVRVRITQGRNIWCEKSFDVELFDRHGTANGVRTYRTYDQLVRGLYQNGHTTSLLSWYWEDKRDNGND